MLPGDWLIPGEHGVCTMAIDIDAAPAEVWPWLAQMGADRAGWYSFDHLDRGGRPSSRRLDPRWTQVGEGDTVDVSVRNGVIVVRPNRPTYSLKRLVAKISGSSSPITSRISIGRRAESRSRRRG